MLRLRVLCGGIAPSEFYTPLAYPSCAAQLVASGIDDVVAKAVDISC